MGTRAGTWGNSKGGGEQENVGYFAHCCLSARDTWAQCANSTNPVTLCNTASSHFLIGTRYTELGTRRYCCRCRLASHNKQREQ